MYWWLLLLSTLWWSACGGIRNLILWLQSMIKKFHRLLMIRLDLGWSCAWFGYQLFWSLLHNRLALCYGVYNHFFLHLLLGRRGRFYNRLVCNFIRFFWSRNFVYWNRTRSYFTCRSFLTWLRFFNYLIFLLTGSNFWWL